MAVEFIGFVNAQNQSETIPPTGPAVNVEQIEASAKVHEQGGFDRTLVAFHSNSPDSLLIAQHVTAVTRDLGVLIAHRPGFVAPTIAARQLATLDHLSRGRVAVHIITGGSDVELQADGDHTTKAERYARTSEYLDIVRQEWGATAPFDHQGRFYDVRGAQSRVLPSRPGSVPIYFGGSSEEAIAVAGRHADVYALWGETYAQVQETVSRVRAAAAPHGRSPRFSLSLRPILADTEEAAWRKADQILERARALQGQTGYVRPAETPNEGSRRLLAAAEQGSRLDKRLWTGMAALTGARGNSTSLVGTPDQVADALLDYYRIGISTFLIRGFDPLLDAYEYGRDLIPRVRALVAAEERALSGRAA
ncbi:alkanesulfonate monooxygenase [Ameyamaea chiangmaiensis NBRC 103196]|uniref:LLM class flavin-dependent oxidoreductase n=1 Tax=Ameyamaea chiangmaiensis TaxID=442969 RepID=A0A850PDG1_9PROT|nr:LLM class flavin-dependent oxidoreductase [Ameyamaea chiangmaiensis]MBS4076365.1 LLM class flavin-dependent oxidoreductase [Ameyamaea chiangmaiensis]NVN40520.1 LLM class flavin-dependent oxidoreductase [Ameyamaea chiangmaiensis]GBQ63541.1 alkanesulfonate monooxygenase [Ameyamaea chiangmaiensis NBRC 103196]